MRQIVHQRERQSHRQRGQVAPLWGLAAFFLIVLGLQLCNYGQLLGWQVRAQNAADAAAQAALIPQANAWNSMELALYDAAVDEYRLWWLTNAYRTIESESGGCQTRPPTGSLVGKVPNSCYNLFVELFDPYFRAASRYYDEVGELHNQTYAATFPFFQSQASAVVTWLGSHCATPTQAGGDCAFAYSLTSFKPRTGLYGVRMFAGPQSVGHINALASINTSIYSPAVAEVTVCHTVTPFLSTFLGFPPQRVVARGAATSVIVNQEWVQPGALQTSFTGSGLPLQAGQQYAPSTDPTINWYGVNYGWNTWSSNGNTFTPSGLSQTGQFDRLISWWGSILVHPLSGDVDPNGVLCK